ncbi:MAG: signal peptidase I [Endozoicomonadaceae bacterium]|nr:signal peptidase I [Endozoicomonadaceae bacterium]
MDFNFPLILVLVVFASGLVGLIDFLVLSPRRRAAVVNYRLDTERYDEEALEKLSRAPSVVETAKSIFPVLLVVLILRSFVYEPFQIPSGSMIPTLEVGDFILVNKYTYGLRLPVIGTKIASVYEPHRGDVVVFKEPMNPKINFIKRVIAVSGDSVAYRHKVLFVNGKEVLENFVAELQDEFEPRLGRALIYRIYEETINGVVHKIRQDMDIDNPLPQTEWTVPEGHYFMMGDNRDRSNDSRYWGFVPEANIVGRAVYIWMHWPSWFDLPNLKNNGRII